MEKKPLKWNARFFFGLGLKWDFLKHIFCQPTIKRTKMYDNIPAYVIGCVVATLFST
jgi:hypothetical protein